MHYEIGSPLRIFYINLMYSYITICLVSLYYVLINFYQRAAIYWAILADDKNNNFLHSFRGDTKMQLLFEIFISHWKKNQCLISHRRIIRYIKCHLLLIIQYVIYLLGNILTAQSHYSKMRTLVFIFVSHFRFRLFRIFVV